MTRQRLDSVLDHIRQLIGLREGPALPDERLLERFVAQRDETAFGELMRRHGPMVFGVCRRVLSNTHAAEDAFQATFLVLARRAGAIARRELLANWLFGVAYRTALKARRTEARGARLQREIPDMASPEPAPESAWNELRPLLDRELAGLPDRYRQAMVLCYLQSKTLEEAALELGCSRGTVKGRLERARELLRSRMARRGIALSASALGVALAQEPLSAAVPTAFMDSTRRAAMLFAAGSAAAAAAPPVIELTEGVLHTMFLTKLKNTIAVLACSAVAAGFATHLTLAGPSSAGGVPATSGDAAALLAPDPAEAKKADPEPKKAAPAMKDNLEVTVVPTKKTFAADDVPNFNFTYVNRTPRDPKAFQAFQLYDIGFEVQSWSCTDAQGRTFKALVNKEFAARAPSQTVVLEAGQSRVQKHPMLGGFKIGDAQAEMLPPGKYHITATIRFAAGRDVKPSGIRFWTGELVTTPVEIEIAK
jgi:RNA polymerase sigma factor (sigma-70 family)